MPEVVIDRTIRRVRWFAVATIVFSLAVKIAEPPPGPDLRTFDSVTIAAQMTCSRGQLESDIRGHEGAFRLSVWLDFPLILAYVTLFVGSGRLEMSRSGRYRVAGLVVVASAALAGGFDVEEDLGLLKPEGFATMICWASIAKWTLISVATIFLAFLFWRKRPLSTEFHVALRTVWLFYAVAGVVGLWGAWIEHPVLERFGAPMSLGVLGQTLILFTRREKFRQHLGNTLPNH